MPRQSVVPLAFEFRKYLGGPSCPRCGDSLLAAESSEFLSEGKVRHFWACDGCGQHFETAVALAAPEPYLESPSPA
jgi:transcription elongation factor Elf1